MSFMVNTSRKHQNPVQERIWDENRKSINEGRRTSDYDRETGRIDIVKKLWWNEEVCKLDDDGRTYFYYFFER